VTVTVNSGSYRPLEATFAGHVLLRGVSLDSDRAAPGGTLELTAGWLAVQAVEGDYLARVLLADGGGQAVAATEHTPGGDRPTNTWQANEEFAGDHYSLGVPGDLAPGTYTLALELVNRADPAQRVEVLSSPHVAAQDNRVAILPITVAAP